MVYNVWLLCKHKATETEAVAAIAIVQASINQWG